MYNATADIDIYQVFQLLSSLLPTRFYNIIYSFKREVTIKVFENKRNDIFLKTINIIIIRNTRLHNARFHTVLK